MSYTFKEGKMKSSILFSISSLHSCPVIHIPRLGLLDVVENRTFNINMIEEVHVHFAKNLLKPAKVVCLVLISKAVDSSPSSGSLCSPPARARAAASCEPLLCLCRAQCHATAPCRSVLASMLSRTSDKIEGRCLV